MNKKNNKEDNVLCISRYNIHELCYIFALGRLVKYPYVIVTNKTSTNLNARPQIYGLILGDEFGGQQAWEA